MQQDLGLKILTAEARLKLVAIHLVKSDKWREILICTMIFLYSKYVS